MHRLYFCLSFLFIHLSILAQTEEGPESPDRILLDSTYAPFYHGVASGDPLPDKVIIWTRLTSTSNQDTVYWEMAKDTLFLQSQQSGMALASSERDHTVKVDVGGLQAGTWYYYRFRNKQKFSVMGRTRTAPVGAVSNARFSVLACSNFQDGFFNAYRDIARKNDVDAVIHLGDYIYEYGINDFSPGIDSSRLHEPQNEILSLGEYRIRHSQYKLDPDLRSVHRQYPFICVWDDHETANDSWMGGAQNHTPASEGNWETRKNAGRKAYFEWMPIRETVSGSPDTIRRELKWGNLADLILLDTRLEGREEQLGTSGSQVTDTNRTLLGSAQREWFKNRLSTSSARWKLIGNQVMISPLRIFGSPVNQDQWDGYPAERKKILNHITNNNISNTVFLTGDIHTSWANDVPLDILTYNATTGQGSVASEFVCSSVTSSSFLTFSVPIGLIKTFNPNVKYADLTKKGYLLLDLNTSRVQGDWNYMSTIQSRNFTSQTGASWRSLHLANKLSQAPSALTPRGNLPSLAPEFLLNTTSTKKRTVLPLGLGIHYNPEFGTLSVQLYQKAGQSLWIRASTIDGKILLEHKVDARQSGLWEGDFRLAPPSGRLMMVSISDGKQIETRKLRW
jgi:alkaline phosphatase D